MKQISEFEGHKNKKELEKLYEKLQNACGRWRRTQQSGGSDAPLHLEIVEAYHRVFLDMVELGWDWERIDYQVMLPTALMPDIVYETLTTKDLMWQLLGTVRWHHQRIGRPTLELYSFDKAYSRSLDLGFNPESILMPQSEGVSSAAWYDTPFSPEAYFDRHPERLAQREALPIDPVPTDPSSREFSIHELMTTLILQVRWWHQKIDQSKEALEAFDDAYTQLLDMKYDPESLLIRQNKKESSVLWYGIPTSPEGYYKRHPERAKNR